MKNLFKLFGVGLLGGLGTRFGVMLADAFFPNGLRSFFDRFNQPRQETVNQNTGAPPSRGMLDIFRGRA